MDGGIITLPLRVGVGGTRVLLRTATGAVGCAAKLGGKATVAATRTAARVSDTVAWGRPAPTFEPPVEAGASAGSICRIGRICRICEQPRPSRSRPSMGTWPSHRAPLRLARLT